MQLEIETMSTRLITTVVKDNFQFTRVGFFSILKSIDMQMFINRSLYTNKDKYRI